ncbi:MAG: TIGR02710 family CRISPR-associated protein [Fimbriimonadaceae bacterium]|nr:TIGR02710 family CRISPR-associated protein [Fimbriimonadaceae bacterium]
MVASVGGSPEPVVASLLDLRPDKVCFVVSEATRNSVPDAILPRLDHAPQYEFLEVTDPQDLLICYAQIRAGLPDWLRRNRLEPSAAIVDYTGGTKTMTAALVLAGVELFRYFRYVGGSARDKAGVGVVLTGSETPIEAANPWDYFADLSRQEAARLLARSLAAAATQVLRAAASRCGPTVGERLRLFADLCEALDLADGFDFAGAARKLAKCTPAFPFVAPNPQVWSGLRDGWQRAANEITSNRAAQTAKNPQLAVEWLANADRRRAQGRYDAAVALLYRVCELHAQDLLHERFGADFGKLKEDGLDPETRAIAVATVGPPRDGVFRLGVEGAFRVLGRDEEYARLRGHLQKRNDSALAHGVRPCTAEDYDEFRADVIRVLGVAEADIPRWPTSAFVVDAG